MAMFIPPPPRYFLDVIEFRFVQGSGRVVARRLALAQHLPDQIVGEHELGVRQPVVVQAHGAFLDIDQDLVALDARQHALEAAAPVDHLGRLDLGLVALEGLEILHPGQWPVDPGAGDLQRVGVLEWVLDIQHRRNRAGDFRAFVHLDPALGPFGHDL
jgi:hypothetical protein